MHTFTIKDCFSYGWQTFKARPLVFIGAGAAIFVVQLLVNILTSFSELVSETEAVAYVAAAILSFLISLVVSTFVNAGTLKFMLVAHDDIKSVRLRDLWAPEHFWRYLVISTVLGLMVLVGLVLLIVPGIFLALGFYTVLYLAIDKKMDLFESLKIGWAQTKGKRWKLFLFSLALLGLNVLGLLLLVVGLLVTIPVSYIASVHVYRALSAETLPVVTE